MIVRYDDQNQTTDGNYPIIGVVNGYLSVDDFQEPAISVTNGASVEGKSIDPSTTTLVDDSDGYAL